jgi:hypothetical protein
MGVVPTRARRLRGKRITPGVARLNVRRALFVRPIHLRRNVKAVPVDKIGKARLFTTSTVTVLPSCIFSSGPGIWPL